MYFYIYRTFGKLPILQVGFWWSQFWQIGLFCRASSGLKALNICVLQTRGSNCPSAVKQDTLDYSSTPQGEKESREIRHARCLSLPPFPEWRGSWRILLLIPGGICGLWSRSKLLETWSPCKPQKPFTAGPQMPLGWFRLFSEVVQ